MGWTVYCFEFSCALKWESPCQEYNLENGKEGNLLELISLFISIIPEFHNVSIVS